MLLALNTQMTFCEQCKSWSSSLRNFLQSPVTSSLLGPHISSAILLTHFLDSIHQNLI
jgi:hypothetical protein